MQILKSMSRKLCTGMLSASLLVGLTMPAFAAPLYKDTQVMAGLFPWTSTWQNSVTRSKSLGVTRGRMDFLWTWVEKRPGVYDFSFYDRVYNHMATNGMKPVFILAYNNTLYGPANSGGNQAGITSSTNRDAYCRFVKAAAARYKGKGVIWEVWNEPDLVNFWAPTPSPTDYATLAKSAVSAIRQSDPNAYVVSAGFGHDYWNRAFIQKAIQAGMLQGYNAMAVHSYDFLNPPQVVENQENLFGQIRQWMSQYNGGKVLPIVDTEFGARLSWQKKVSNDPVDYAAKQTIRMNLDHYYSGVFLSSVYGMDAKDELGLSRDSKITAALKYVNTLLADYEGTNANYGGKTRAILFTNKATGKKIVALWSTEGQQTVTFPQALRVQGVYNVLGQSRANAGVLGNFTLNVFHGPMFFVLG